VAVFISYSSRDEGAVRQLVADLRAARMEVWLDEQLWGGDTWWQTILHEIRNCSVLVVALSSHSLQSQPCMAELRYAQALGLGVLPVQIGTLTSLRALPLAQVQVVDYRERTSVASIALISAVHENAARRKALPDPLPPEPPIPYGYLIRLSTLVASATVLDPHEQAGVVAQLRQALDEEHESAVRDDVIGLLRQLRDRPDVTFRAAKEIDALLPTISRPRGQPSATQEAATGHDPLPDQEIPVSRSPTAASPTDRPVRGAPVPVWRRLLGRPAHRWVAVTALVAVVATAIILSTLSHGAGDGSTPTTRPTPTASSSAALVAVPKVRGMTVDAATVALEQKLLAVKATAAAGEGLARGTAVGTSPAAGQSVPPGSTVTLQVSDGKIRIPNVVGLTGFPLVTWRHPLRGRPCDGRDETQV
jgi:hypothetical protein